MPHSTSSSQQQPSSSSGTSKALFQLARSTYSNLRSSYAPSVDSSTNATSSIQTTEFARRALPVEYWNAAKKRWTKDGCNFTVQQYKNSKTKKVLVLRQPYKEIHGGNVVFKLDPTLSVEHVHPISRDFNAVFHGSGGKHRVAFFGEQEALDFIKYLQKNFGCQVHKKRLEMDEIDGAVVKKAINRSVWYEKGKIEEETGSRGLGNTAKKIVRSGEGTDEDDDSSNDNSDIIDPAELSGDLTRCNFDDYPDEVFDNNGSVVNVQAQMFYPRPKSRSSLKSQPSWIRKSFEELDLDISRTAKQKRKLASSSSSSIQTADVAKQRSSISPRHREETEDDKMEEEENVVKDEDEEKRRRRRAKKKRKKERRRRKRQMEADEMRDSSSSSSSTSAEETLV